jgi:hypothetical protein
MTKITHNFTAAPNQFVNAKRRTEHWPELPQLGWRSVDRCEVFPLAHGVEAIYVNRRDSMKSILCAAIGTAHWINGRSYRPGPSKQQLCSARAIHYSLLRSLHQVRFALKAERQMSLRRNGHSLLASTQKLDPPAAMSLLARWSNTT